MSKTSRQWMLSLGDPTFHYAQMTTHILNNYIVYCGPINSTCLQHICCMMIPRSTRSPKQQRQTLSLPTSWRASTTHPRKCKARILVTLQLRMGYSIVITSFTYQLAHVAPEYYKHAMVILLSDTLGSRKHWCYCLRDFGGLNLGNWSKKLSNLLTYVLAPKRLTIVHTTFYTHFQFPIDLELLSPWTLSPTFLGSVTMTQC